MSTKDDVSDIAMAAMREAIKQASVTEAEVEEVVSDISSPMIVTSPEDDLLQLKQKLDESSQSVKSMINRLAEKRQLTKRLLASKQHLQRYMEEPMSQKDVFNFESADFDGLEALRAMTAGVKQARFKMSVCNEDLRNFINARKLELS